MRSNGRAFIAALVFVSVLARAPRAAAFCGFYAAMSDATLSNHSTTVVLMREGDRTVLSMQPDYEGPPEDFALVVPVPTVVRREDVRTLDRALFERIERLTGPRLMDYWERDPCAPDRFDSDPFAVFGSGGSGSGAGSEPEGSGPPVRVEERFAVGEYDVVVLGARESSALESWLVAHRYRIPQGAGELLRPYVEGGMKFFVVRVNGSRVRFENGRAVLSPIRVHYVSSEFALPIRLGLLSSAGSQDVVALILARGQRFEVANRPNVFLPTNLDVSERVRDDFGGFYEALLDRVFARSPGAVVTEYAWQSSSCDLCPPETTLDAEALMALGGDVLFPRGVLPGARGFRFERPLVRGTLAADMVVRVGRRHANEVRFCYEQTIAQGFDVAGPLDLVLTIEGATGVVREASAVARPGSQIPEALATCIANAARRWVFPTSGPTVSRVSAPITFASNTPAPDVARENEFVVTRLRVRYGRDDSGEDLVFRAAPPVTGGREVRSAEGSLEQVVTAASRNEFQGRYVIRHSWRGDVSCDRPIRGRWLRGRPPASDGADGSGSPHIIVAPAHPPAVRGASAGVNLEPLLVSPVPELGLAGGNVARDSASREATRLGPEEATPPPEPTVSSSSSAHSPDPSAQPPVTSPRGLCALAPRRANASVLRLLGAALVSALAIRRARRRGARSFDARCSRTSAATR